VELTCRALRRIWSKVAQCLLTPIRKIQQRRKRSMCSVGLGDFFDKVELPLWDGVDYGIKSIPNLTCPECNRVDISIVKKLQLCTCREHFFEVDDAER